MTADPFTEAARAEALSDRQYGKVRDERDRKLMAGAFIIGAEWARADFAAQETYGERAPCGCDLTGPVPPAVHIVDRHEEER